jgi:hypothetical protein
MRPIGPKVHALLMLVAPPWPYRAQHRDLGREGAIELAQTPEQPPE